MHAYNYNYSYAIASYVASCNADENTRMGMQTSYAAIYTELDIAIHMNICSYKCRHRKYTIKY